jgi:hypothetical protein
MPGLSDAPNFFDFLLEMQAARCSNKQWRPSSEPEPETAMPVHLLPKTLHVALRRRRQKSEAEDSPIGADGVVLALAPPTPGSTEGHDKGGLVNNQRR